MQKLRVIGLDDNRPFVGRARELQRLSHAAREAFDGTGRLVLISGQAGIGKTSLALRFLSQLQYPGLQMAVGRCYDLSRNSPYAPWIKITDALDGEHDAPISSRLFPPQHGDLTSSEALFARMVGFLRERAQSEAVALMLDDIHWADTPSLEFLRYLTTQLDDLPLLVICTYRNDELERGDYLYTLLPLLIREGPAARIELQALDEHALREWVSTSYGLSEADQSRLVHYLLQRSEGNPFFAGELLRSLEDREALVEVEPRRWQLRDLEAVGVPELLQQVLEARLQSVSADVREILSTAAVIGQQVEVRALESLVDETRDSLAGALDRALGARLLRTAGEGWLQFEHALLRDTLYEQLGAMHRRALHQRVAEAFVELTPHDVDAIAFHFERAGDPRELEWLVRSGDRAARALARLTAAEKYERALALIMHDDRRRSERAWLLFRLADARRLAEPRRSLEYLEEALDLAAQLDDRPLTAMSRFTRGMVLCLLDNPNGLDELLAGDAALDELHESERRRIYDELAIDVEGRKGEIATWVASFGQYDMAVQIAETYLNEVATASRLSQRTVADAWDGIGVSHAAMGRPADAVAALRRSVETFERQGNYYSAAVSTWEELLNVTLIYYPDDINRREETALRGRDFFRKSREAQVDLHPDWPLVPIYFIEGEWERAYESAEQTLQTDAWSVGPLFWLGAIESSRGDHDKARERVFQGLPAGYDAQPGSCLIFNALRLLHLGGALALSQGDVDEAAAWAACIGEWLDWSGRVIGRSDLEGLRGRIEFERGNYDVALERLDASMQLASDPRQPMALLAVHRERARVLMHLEHLDAAAASLNISEQLAENCRARYSLALALLVRIELDLQQGQYVSARTAIGRARRILSSVGAAPALQHLAKFERQFEASATREALPAGLTKREIEVLALVAQGMTDAEVAAQLGISHRTVSNHLGSIYSKLDVSSRAAATRFAVENQLV